MIDLRPLTYLHDVTTLGTNKYDLVLTDFEPVTAWAARFKGTRSLAIGHQYALSPSSPLPVGDYFSRWLIKQFAPADSSIGFHWHPYRDNVLPPIIDTSLSPINSGQMFTLVYLPFDELDSVVELLQQLRREHFVVYSPVVKVETQRCNVSIYPLSTCGFKHHLQRCSRIVCNTGFELISEALFLGIPVLTKPVEGQFEQMANAMALKQLRLATVTRALSVLNLDAFINQSTRGEQILYPSVAKALVNHCLHGAPGDLPELSQLLWSQVGINNREVIAVRALTAA